MNTNDENQDTVQNPAYNPFPEPQTIPSGWDMSEFLEAPGPIPEEPSADSKTLQNTAGK